MTKSIDLNPDYDAIELADSIGRAYGLSLADADALDQIVGHVRGAIDRARANPIVLHGRRVEAMFGHIAASLGKCRLVKREDAGRVYAAPPEGVIAPDYRIITDTGDSLLVEVKNWRPNNPTHPISFKSDYVAMLQRYADTSGGTLRLAIYWSQWNLWSLTDPSRLTPEGDKLELSVTDALQYNELATLGDFMIGTTPPLKLRVLTDPTKPRTVSTNGQAAFTIKEMKLFAGDTEITDDRERNLALYFMFYGRWIEEEPLVDISDNELLAIDFIAQPVEKSDPSQGFEMIGHMSSMISRQYDDLTSRGAAITRLAPAVDPTALGSKLPGKVADLGFPLWVFHVNPADE